MKKIFGWVLATGGIICECFAVTGMQMDLMHVLIRSGLMFGGIALLVTGLFMIASGPKRQKYQEYDFRDAYVDELEQRRKSKESWESIKKAQDGMK